MNLSAQMERNAWQDRLLTQLDSAMQGSLLPCLPPDLTTRTAQRRQIRTAAERLTFCYAAANPGADAAALSACRNRLYAALTYLRYECNSGDCTYHSIAKLLSLDGDTLHHMLDMARHTPRRLLRHYKWVHDDQPLAGDVNSMVRFRLAQEGKLPSEQLCTRAVSAALAVLRGMA